MTEIDQLIQKSYEDMTKGLFEERFSTLTVSLETEQTQLKAAIPEMEAILDATAADFQRFIERARQVDIHYNTIGLWTEPDPETLEQE